MSDDRRSTMAEWVNEVCGDYVEPWVGDCIAENVEAQLNDLERERDEAISKAEIAEGARQTVQRRCDALERELAEALRRLDSARRTIFVMDEGSEELRRKLETQARIKKSLHNRVDAKDEVIDKAVVREVELGHEIVALRGELKEAREAHRRTEDTLRRTLERAEKAERARDKALEWGHGTIDALLAECDALERERDQARKTRDRWFEQCQRNADRMEKLERERDEARADAHSERDEWRAVADALERERDEARRLAEQLSYEIAQKQERVMGPYVRRSPPTCPTCGSPDPRRHPAVQWEGEVSPCGDLWHKGRNDG